MLNPNSDLEAIFERSVKIASKNKHEYITLEHFLYSMLLDEKFKNLLDNFGADVDTLKDDLEKFIAERDDIKVTDLLDRPRKTNSVERMLNRAFTSVLFGGRTVIEPKDCFIALFSEKKSHAAYLLKKSNIDKDKFVDFINQEELTRSDEEVEEVNYSQLEKM